MYTYASSLSLSCVDVGVFHESESFSGRQICCDKLSELGEQEVKHQRLVTLLEAEKDMWLQRRDRGC